MHSVKPFSKRNFRAQRELDEDELSVTHLETNSSSNIIDTLSSPDVVPETLEQNFQSELDDVLGNKSLLKQVGRVFAKISIN